MKRNCLLFGRRLKSCRLNKGWVLKQLAAETGLNINYLSQVERGLKNISYTNQTIVLGAMKISFADFFKVEEYQKVLPFVAKSSKNKDEE